MDLGAGAWQSSLEQQLEVEGKSEEMDSKEGGMPRRRVQAAVGLGRGGEVELKYEIEDLHTCMDISSVLSPPAPVCPVRQGSWDDRESAADGLPHSPHCRGYECL